MLAISETARERRAHINYVEERLVDYIDWGQWMAIHKRNEHDWRDIPESPCRVCDTFYQLWTLGKMP